MKKAILTIGLFSLAMVLTPFTTTEASNTSKAENNVHVDINGGGAAGGNMKVDINGGGAAGGNMKVDINGGGAAGGNMKVD
jgi:hypothetical protein